MSNKAKIYITAAVALVAALVLVLCILGGVFDFSPKEKVESDALATPDPAAAASDFVPSTENIDSGDLTTPPPVEDVIPQTEVYTISIIAGKGGTVNPRGSVEVNEGESVSFTIIPDDGYEIFQLIIDGEIVETVDVYSFIEVDSDHSLYVVFAPETSKESEEPTDDPGIEDDFDDYTDDVYDDYNESNGFEDHYDDSVEDDYSFGRRNMQGTDNQ